MKINTPWFCLICTFRRHYWQIVLDFDLYEENTPSYSTERSMVKDLIAFILRGKYSFCEGSYIFMAPFTASYFNSIFRLDRPEFNDCEDDLDDIPY